MYKEVEVKLNNVLRAESDYIMKNEKDISKKLDKMNTLFNLKKIIDNYDELEPVLKEYFKYKEDKSREDR